MRITLRFAFLLFALATLVGTSTSSEARQRQNPIWIIGPDRPGPYQRPPGATTRQQRQSVQGQPCITCGQTAPRMNADHRRPLIQQHMMGGVDRDAMRRPDAVQPQCPTCSARQGGELGATARRIQRNLEASPPQPARTTCPVADLIRNRGRC
jgi:hypothetical protein